MKRTRTQDLLGATGLALILATAPLAAQTTAPAQVPDAQAANTNEPLNAPADHSSVPVRGFANLVEQVSPAVVNITTTATISQPVPGIRGLPENSPFRDLFREFGMPNGPQAPEMRERESNALGSGFIISADGFLVTNNHVIQGADEIEIELKDGRRLAAEVVGTDVNTDIALLKVEGEDLPFVAFGDSDEARVGDWVLALGNPLGQGLSASTGIVSARGRALQGEYDDFIQTDAAINRGNSGGPLFNMQGDVIGVNTAILSPNGGSIGIGFSMASNVVEGVIAQLKEFGETRRGWLGVVIQPVTEDVAEALGLDEVSGALISSVPEGPAAEAGLQAGDVIIAFDGNPVKDSRDLVRQVGLAPVGDAVEVRVLRDGEEESIEVTLGRREVALGDAQVSSVATPGEVEGEVLGMQLSPLTPEIATELNVASDREGLVVREVDIDSAAADRGLAAGDLITAAGGEPVTRVSDLSDALERTREDGRRSVLILIERGGEQRYVALPTDEDE